MHGNESHLMPRTASPLRYPGGKACLLDMISEILRINRLERTAYAEPYAGGCGLALSLLFGGYVSRVYINDLDRSIWAIWDSILNQTDAFVALMDSTPVTLDEWHHQKQILDEAAHHDDLEVGFAAFFLNRTNRSGVIRNAGVIGGFEQSGAYKIDCRFNKPDLVARIRRIARYRSRIHLSNLDALDFLKMASRDKPQDCFFYIDPPYYRKGSSLYTNHYNPQGHQELSAHMLEIENPWVMTYDQCDEVRRLYKGNRQFDISLNYSLQVKRLGAELLIASKGLHLPTAVRKRQSHQPQYVRVVKMSATQVPTDPERPPPCQQTCGKQVKAPSLDRLCNTKGQRQEQS